MGGYAAFAFAHKYPRRLRALVLADTRPGSDSLEALANRASVAQLAEVRGAGAIADLQLPRLISDYTRQHHPEVEAHVRQLIEAATPHGIAAASSGMARRIDSTRYLRDISCPTLVIAGEEDALISAQHAREYAAQIPNAQFVSIPHAGHLANLEQPQAFINAVRRFLRTLA
jgi:pimeloyl-ACP methyl ester carboxylesterase